VLVDYHHILMELVVILLLWGLTFLVRRINRGSRMRRLCRYGWVLVLWVLSIINLGPYWFAYPMALWMLLALGLVFIQLIHNHEFIYRRYWPVFWRWSMFYAVIVFIGSLFSGGLPLI
jgi:hypothetical protein